ncbi:MAG TPA: MFS transporter, partial [Ramlibacter sp.]
MTDAAPPPPRALGLTVAAAQLALALSWTVYMIFLPALAAQAGLRPSAVILLLMLDQLVFVLADYACGVASDRVLALQARLGPWLVGLTLLSAAAFVSLPVLAPEGSPALFIAVTLLWTATSSVLRAPPMNLIGRHAQRPAQPAMVALAMLGLGLAAALAPWLALVLKGQDARLPFVVASLGVCAAALAMAAAEQRVRR